MEGIVASPLTPMAALQRIFLVPFHPGGQPRPSPAIRPHSDLCSLLLLNDLPILSRKWSKGSYRVCWR